MLERKNRKQIMEARGVEKLAMVQAQGKETYMEKHLFTQLKYQVQSDAQKEKRIHAAAIKDDIHTIIHKNYIERELKKKAGGRFYEDRVRQGRSQLTKKQRAISALEEKE